MEAIKAAECPDNDLVIGPARRPNPIRRLYEWCLSWADTPYGTPALFVMSFAESSFFPIPPDVLQIALSVSKPTRAFFYAAVSAVASVLGAIVGWLIGWGAWHACADFFYTCIPGFTEEKFLHVQHLYTEWGFLALLVSAFTPIPFKVFTIASGAFGFSLPTLIFASAIGRSARFFLVGGTIYAFGPKVKEWIDRYFNIATILLGVLFVAGILAIKLLH